MTTQVTETVHLPAGTIADRAALRDVFQSIDANSCPLQYNFHLHTTHSDGRLSPVDLLEQALAIGLRGFAVTDHHSVAGYIAVKRILDARRAHQTEANQTEVNQASAHQARTHQTEANRPQPGLPYLWSGVEITATLLAGDVHLLGYAFDPLARSLQPYLNGHEPVGEAKDAARVIEAIHQAGGLAVLAHPVRYRQSAEDLIPAAVDLGIDGVETYYAYGNPSPWQASPQQTALVKGLSDRFNLLNTCGTDTHGLNLRQRI